MNHRPAPSLTLDDFDFPLPPELIAQHPAPQRTASRLLHVAGTALAEVAYATGFSSQSHFTSRFRQIIGVTPGAFRGGVTG